eukprot:TRINITY_DN86_c1_g1_i1.p1 TRINITY_DN86_c1_g1~~TRINITY_DN86_c1_g1_i1.p1  ORF type:complete len:1167 (-),score=297.18 TRINITY_DN86_c1_g1_i1:206-3679(-)
MTNQTLLGGVTIFVLAMLFFAGVLVYMWQRYRETQPPSTWDRMLAAVARSFHTELDRSFGKLGQFISEHRHFVILIVIVVGGVLSIGFSVIKKEYRISHLWVEQGTRVVKENDLFESTFGFGRGEYWQVTQKDRSNVLTVAGIQEVYKSFQMAMNVTADVSQIGIPGLDTVNLHDVCDEAEVPKLAFQLIINGTVYGVVFPAMLQEEINAAIAAETAAYLAIVTADTIANNPTLNATQIQTLVYINMTSPETAAYIEAAVTAQTATIFQTAYSRLFNPNDPQTSSIPTLQFTQTFVAHLLNNIDTNLYWRFPCFRKVAIDCFREGDVDYLYPGNEAVPDPRLYNLRQIITLGGLPNFFESKPSMFNITDEDVPRILQGGCRQFGDVLIPAGVMIGGIERNAQGDWTGAVAFRSVLDIASPIVMKRKLQRYVTSDHVITDNEALNVVLAWETALIEGFAEFSANSDFDVTYFMERSSDDVIKDALAQTTGLLIGSYVLMFMYALLTMLRVPDWVGTRGLLSLAGVALVLLGLSSALGLSAFCGIRFNPISTNILPFLGLAIGVDEVFVFLSSCPENVGEYKTMATHQLTSIMLSRAGPAITLTAMSNVLAFFMGSLTPIPAVTAFTQQAGLIIFCNYFMLIFGLTALVSYDFDRVKKQGNCLIPCVPSTQKDEAWDFMIGLSRFAKNTYGPALSNPWVKAIVLVAFAVWFGVCIYGISLMKLGLDLSDVTPNDSYLHQFLLVTQDYFNVWPGSFVVDAVHSLTATQIAAYQAQKNLMATGWLSKDVTIQDLSCHTGLVKYTCFAHGIIQLQTPIAQTPTMIQDGLVMNPVDLPLPCQQLLANLQLPPGPLQGASLLPVSYKVVDESEWPGSLEYHSDIPTCAPTTGSCYTVRIPANYTLPPPHYDAYMKAYITTLGIPSLNSVYFEDGVVVRSKVTLVIENLVDNSDFVTMMRDTRKATDAVAPTHAFPSGTPYTYWEQYLHIRQVLGENLGLALFAVFLVTLFFLMNPLLAIELAVVMVVTLMQIYGLMAFAGMSLNAVPVVNLIMATGVTVNFTVHMGYSFLLNTGTRDERVNKCLGEMFAPILHGGVSNLIGIVMIAFSVNQYFVVYFFRMYVIMIMMGLINELLLLAVILSLIGPRSVHDELPNDGAKELTPMS